MIAPLIGNRDQDFIKRSRPLIPSVFASVPRIVKDFKLFFALSRTPHGLVDMTTPALGVLLYLGHWPSLPVMVIGLLTAFAAYTAVYALNDVIDLRTDRQKVCDGGYCDGEVYLDGALIRHPLAKGALSLQAGLIWTLAWGLIALAGAWLLNPVCMFIFLAGCILEAGYCLLWRVTPLRTVVSGLVKTLGPVAAVFAVDPDPSILLLAVLVLWLFCWEIGGQNIPNDWTDIQEDRHFNARTIPVVLGLRRAGLISLVALVCAMFLNLLIFWLSPLDFGPLLPLLALTANAWLLLQPALRLQEIPERQNAMRLFNSASMYPLANLALVLMAILF
jgi:4-hydroxybenzoate polyprenyltransferase